VFLQLISFLSEIDTGFNVLNYLTLRAVLSTLTALLICLFAGSFFIRKITKLQIKQIIRQDGPQTHLIKQGTPTMGGVLILFSFLVSVLIWGDFSNHYLWVVVFTSIWFAGIGFYDDFLKIKYKNSDGLSAKFKIISQSVGALIVGFWLFNASSVPEQTQLIAPFFKEVMIPLGLSGFLIVSLLTILGSSNAVNLTDGLDGLAIMPIILVSITLAVFAYISGNIVFSEYLNFPFILGTGELMIICGALVGSGIGFLWFNTYPAEIFMGDVGSLFLGAVIAVIAIMVRQELLLLIIGGVFVAEVLSVIIQVTSFKLRGKRIFLMAPIHHHFEQKGWSEPKIIVRFWMITLMLVLIGLASLKIR
jgi:phospho-N-acetylmuramoyl-pentapeptide-transferase